LESKNYHLEEIIDELEKDNIERAEVLKSRVKWDAFSEVYYTREDMNIMSSFDKRILERVDLLNQNGQNIARIFLILLTKLKNKDDLKYVITLVDDTLHYPEIPDMWRRFEALSTLKLPGMPPNPPFGTLFGLLRDHSNEPYLLNKAASILALFVNKFSSVEDDVVLQTVSYFIEKLKEPKPNNKFIDIPKYFRIQINLLESLRDILRNDKFKRAFIKNHGLKPLFTVLSIDSSTVEVKSFEVQLYYTALYCIWLLTFLKETRKEMGDPFMIRNLCFILKIVGKDKVIRLSLAILRNLLGVSKADFLMISFGLPKSLEIIKLKPALLADKDIQEDVITLEESLEKKVDDLSTFDVYRNEVLSTKLEWSPAHKSQKFWSENCFRFEEADNLLLRTLKDILSDNETDPVVLVIACWDVGEFVRFHPRGRKIVEFVDIKAPITRLLTYKNETVESAALLALQKILLNNWDLYLNMHNQT